MNVLDSVVPILGIRSVVGSIKERDQKHYEQNHNNDLLDGQIRKNFADFTLFLVNFLNQLPIQLKLITLVIFFVL